MTGQTKGLQATVLTGCAFLVALCTVLKQPPNTSYSFINNASLMYSYHYSKQKQRPRTKRYNTRTVKEPKRQPRTRAALFMALLLIIVFNKSVRKPDHIDGILQNCSMWQRMKTTTRETGLYGEGRIISHWNFIWWKADNNILMAQGMRRPVVIGRAFVTVSNMLSTRSDHLPLIDGSQSRLGQLRPSSGLQMNAAIALCR